jgi:HK97 family phage prohead protease
MALRNWFRSRSLEFAADVATAPAFSVTVEEATGVDIDPAVFGLTAYADPVAISPRVSRRTALQVPAVKRARDLICGALGSLPLELYGPDGTRRYSALFAQPERNVPRSVTFTRTYEDMFFEGVAWWKVTAYGWHGFPVEVVRLDPTTVNVTQEGKVYRTTDGHTGVAVEWMQDKDLIRFDSPNEPILTAGARAIRTLLNLDAAAASYADEPLPLGYFTPADGETEPADDDEIAEILNDWHTARKTRVVGYVPSLLKYNSVQFNAEQMQLAEQRQHGVLEIARLTGVNPEDLGVSTTSRTYFNAFDKRKDFLDFTTGNYRQAFEDRVSMPDVTPRGYTGRVNYDAFLRSDPKSRYEAYAAGKAVGVLTDEDIAAAEGKPGRALEAAPADTTPAPALEENTVPTLDITAAVNRAVTRLGARGVSFAGAPSLAFDLPGAGTIEVDRERRIIRGLAVPYGVVGTRPDGKRYRFSRGTLTWSDVSRVKLWAMHDPNQAVGVAIELEDTDAGLFAGFKVARGAEGDRALTMAEDGVWDGLSIGLGVGASFALDRDGVLVPAGSVPLMEVSLTPAPVFDDARVHSVAASAAATTTTGRNIMECTKCGKVHAANVVECNAADLAAFSAAQQGAQGGQQGAPAVEPGAPIDFAAIGQALVGAFAQGAPSAQLAPAAPVLPARETVPAGTGFTQVNEAPMYRFDGLMGQHDFSSDLINGLKFNDTEAMGRVNEFIGKEFPARFAVEAADVTALNPTKTRPDMYVDQLEYTTPLYDALYKGGLTDATPFTFPKFASAAGLVGDHAEGVEPASGDFSATSQTVTPKPVSGKVEIPREIIDAGGNPQVSSLIWNQMVRAWKEKLEAEAATLLSSQVYDGAHTIALVGVDDVLVSQFKAEIAALRFLRGGNRFRVAPMHKDLYLALTGAQDAAGRSLLPIISPQNADGTTAPALEYVDVAGVKGTPSWALEQLGTPVSFMANPEDAHVWNSAPSRLSFEYRVALIDLAVWGYVAKAVSRIDGLRKVTYADA